MKKLSTIIMALALVLGMSQCKKQETPTSATPSNPGVHITVNVGDQDGKDGKDNNGEKHNIAPAYGLFSFSNNDTLYVGHNGKYVGCLKYTNGFFDGTIYPDENVDDKPLHFYFVGNAEVTETPTVNQTTSLSISIADQSENLPVLSYGASTKPFTGEGTTYSTTLKNKCALVRFNLQNEGSYEVTLSNVPTLATVNFANPTAETAIVATEGQTNANMTLYGEEGNTAFRWAILLPGTNLSSGHGDLTITYNGDVNLAELAYNDYVNSGISINNPKPAPALDYAVHTSGDVLTQFSVSQNKKVYFSRANLKCDATNPDQLVWGFHENQIDGCFGSASGSSSPQNGSVPAGNEMDRFSWGFHYPTTTGENDYVTGSVNLDVNDGTDWGCVLTGQGNDHWRTLTSAEWNYLLNDKTGVRGNNRFLKTRIKWYNIYNPNLEVTYTGKVISGIFITPDKFNPSNYTFSTSIGWNNKTSALISSTDATILLEAGCVFLPALGYRISSTSEDAYNDYYYISGSTTNFQFQGYYWSATGGEQLPGSEQIPKADALWFDHYDYPSNIAQTRNLGMCVRLVWDAN